MSKEFNAFEMAQSQFDSVADKLQLDSGLRDLLRWPQREYHFTIPVRMDDGSVKVSSSTFPSVAARVESFVTLTIFRPANRRPCAADGCDR
jgi:hypothetical protein